MTQSNSFGLKGAGAGAGGLGEATHLHLLHKVSRGGLLQGLGNLLQLGLSKSCHLHLGRTTAREVSHGSLLQQIFLFFVHGSRPVLPCICVSFNTCTNLDIIKASVP